MATFKVNRRTEKSCSIWPSGIFLLLVANFPLVATSVTWTAPPPAWTPTNPDDVRTVYMKVRNGSSQVHLRWNYNLSPGSKLQFTTFSIGDGTDSVIGVKGSSITVFDTRFAISSSEVATLIINRITERSRGVYQCQLTTDSNTWRSRIKVYVAIPAELRDVSGDKTVHEGSSIYLSCEAYGYPTPKITWTKVLEDGDSKVLHQGSTWIVPNIKRTASGTYRCTAYNGFGNPDSHELKVNVIYPAKIVEVIASKNKVAVQESVSLRCKAEGNPSPSYRWTPCEQPQSVCHNSVLNISEVLNDAVYICTVTNSLNSDAGNVSVFIAGNLINVTLVITNEKCSDGKYNQSLLWTKLNETTDKLFANKSGFNGAQLKSVRCGHGSVVADLGLKFSSTIREREVIDILRNAAKNGMLGTFQVSASSIIGTRPVAGKATPTTPTGEKTWIIVGAVLGSLAVLCVVAVITWRVYKKRKFYRRYTGVHNSESQVNSTENAEEDYADVNRGYVLPEPNSTVVSPSSVPPVTCDTVEESTKKGKGEVLEVNPTVSYAAVDKSKNEKRKKKPKPGEVQYAELAEFPRPQGTPRPSTSRDTETQYADLNAM
ncbi:uncharacterized protein LOC144662810 [Oculina patagonica]